MNYICLLSVKPTIDTYNFYKYIKQNSSYKVIIVIDDNDYNIPNYDNEVKIIKINNEVCKKAGYYGSVLQLKNRSCSRDKALYYFNTNNIDYNYIWFIEEDVFIPDISTIINMDNKYINDDLLCRSHEIINERKTHWHWNHVNNNIKINPPYAKSMICAIRCSKKLMNCIHNYATMYKSLFLDEALFNTLALQNNLTVNTIPELSTIIFRRFWKLEEFEITNLYHPVKNIERQLKLRKHIKLNNTT
jgi:hypothetical protein